MWRKIRKPAPAETFTKWLARAATRAKTASRRMAKAAGQAKKDAISKRFWANNLGRLRALVENDESLEPVLIELEGLE